MVAARGSSRPLQEDVPVHPAEHQFAPVVSFGFFQKGEGADAGQRIASGQRLLRIVEIDQHAFTKARLDEAVGVPIKIGRISDLPA